MFLVARVDALGAVAGVEVDVELEAGELFEDRDAVFFGGAGVHRGFVDDDVALLEHLADGLGGLDQRGEVGLLVLVDGGGDGDDEAVVVSAGRFEVTGCELGTGLGTRASSCRSLPAAPQLARFEASETARADASLAVMVIRAPENGRAT